MNYTRKLMNINIFLMFKLVDYNSKVITHATHYLTVLYLSRLLIEIYLQNVTILYILVMFVTASVSFCTTFHIILAHIIQVIKKYVLTQQNPLILCDKNSINNP